MIKIRLSRGGVRNKPVYRVVATDHRAKNKGKFLEVLGYWYPSKKIFKINKEKLEKWLKNGAKVTQAVEKLIKG